MYFLFEKDQQFVIAENVNEAKYLFGELDEEKEEE